MDIIHAFITTHKEIFEELISPVVDELPKIVLKQWEDIKTAIQVETGIEDTPQKQFGNFYIASCSDHKDYPEGQDIIYSEVLQRSLDWTQKIEKPRYFNLLSITPCTVE